MKNRGYLMTFEGIDQCGKSTQVKALIRRLEESGYPVQSWRDPGSTSVSEQIRDILLSSRNLGMVSLTELLLYEAARAQLVHEKVLPALSDGCIVILDRFYDSTTAYQGYGRGIDLNLIHQANTIATGGLVPDLTFYLDIDWEESRRRKGKQNLDRMEQENRNFFDRVRAGYQTLSETEPQRIIRLDGAQDIHTIEALIWKEVITRLVPLDPSASSVNP